MLPHEVISHARHHYEFAESLQTRKSVLSKNFMHILAIRSQDGHLLARFYMGSPP
jgi:hypothetical protein